MALTARSQLSCVWTGLVCKGGWRFDQLGWRLDQPNLRLGNRALLRRSEAEAKARSVHWHEVYPGTKCAPARSVLSLGAEVCTALEPVTARGVKHSRCVHEHCRDSSTLCTRVSPRAASQSLLSVCSDLRLLACLRLSYASISAGHAHSVISRGSQAPACLLVSGMLVRSLHMPMALPWALAL